MSVVAAMGRFSGGGGLPILRRPRWPALCGITRPTNGNGPDAFDEPGWRFVARHSTGPAPVPILAPLAPPAGA